MILRIALSTYQEILSDSVRFREWLDGMIASYPELFPVGIEKGYVLHDILPEPSKLTGIRFRRIKLKDSDEEGGSVVLTIASRFGFFGLESRPP